MRNSVGVIGLIAGFACAVGFVPVSSQAQDTPAAFVHGLNSSGATWTTAATRIREEFQVSTQQPNLGWQAPFSQQAVDLQGQIPGSTIAVGHSNGGLASREWNRQYGVNDRLVTVGTPHQGAPLAANVLNGEAYAYAGSLFWGVGNAWNYYAYWEAQRFRGTFPYYVLSGIHGIAYFARAIPTLLGTMGFTTGAEAVLGDISPGSTFLNSVNSSANIARESQALTARVSITSQFPTAINMQMYLLAPENPGPWIAAREIGWAGSVLTYLYYQYWLDWDDPYYYELHGGAHLWAIAALRIMDMDASWCYLVGTLQSYTRYGLVGYTVGCAPSDGVVPVSSQDFPNRTRLRQVVGPNHVNETRAPEVIDALVATFSQDFNVRRRGGSGGGAPPVLGIDGPTQIRPGATCTWYANASGGNPPYAYQWTINEALVGDASSYTGSKPVGSGGSSFRLKVFVTSTGGGQSEQEITVFEDSSGQVCPY